MERLPYIDDHARAIGASPDDVWHALVRFVGGWAAVPDVLADAWGLEHRRRRGNWRGSVNVGDAAPGFAVALVDAPHRLALRGRHRFSDYELRFDLEPLEPRRTLLRATTFAVFPGAGGRVYRLLVIGTRGHVLAVWRLLAGVARRAEQRSAGSAEHCRPNPVQVARRAV
jgi:hypothetical protein